MSVVWEDPEPVTRAGRRSTWGPRLAQLDGDPGRWALVGENASSAGAADLRKRYPLYEFTTRGQKNGRVAKLYARRRVEEEP